MTVAELIERLQALPGAALVSSVCVVLGADDTDISDVVYERGLTLIETTYAPYQPWVGGADDED